MNTLPVKVAVIDLYNGIPNEGMRCIRQILKDNDGQYFGQRIEFREFDARSADEIPGMDHDIYISTGGPGSPFDSEGSVWEKKYFNWLDSIWQKNDNPDTDIKCVMAICHSYQMVARHFSLAEVTERRTGAFGIHPVHITREGKNDPIFTGLADPFYAADFRDWQVLQPRQDVLDRLGARILAIEKERPHVDLERAVMAIRLSKQIIALQFHPEADPEGMRRHFQKPEQKNKIIDIHGESKYNRFIRNLADPEILRPTYQNMIPGFLKRSIAQLRPEVAFAENTVGYTR
jgi:homoserine O-succinyltransferase/O-acetyltransferase